MADENQIDQGAAVPPRAEKEGERGVSHARKAAEISARRQAQQRMNIARAGKKSGMMRFIVSAVSRMTARNLYAPTQRKRSLPHLGLVSYLG